MKVVVSRRKQRKRQKGPETLKQKLIIFSSIHNYLYIHSRAEFMNKQQIVVIRTAKRDEDSTKE